MGHLEPSFFGQSPQVSRSSSEGVRASSVTAPIVLDNALPPATRNNRVTGTSITDRESLNHVKIGDRGACHPLFSIRAIISVAPKCAFGRGDHDVYP